MAQPGPVAGPTYYGRRYILGRQAGEWFIWDQRRAGTPVFRSPDTPEGWRDASKRYGRLEPSPGVRAMIITGIVLVSIWMFIWLVYSWLILGLGSNYVCEGQPNASACFDRYTLWWGMLLLLHLAAILAAIVLWVVPRTRVWGLVVGLVATAVPAIVFTVAFDVPV